MSEPKHAGECLLCRQLTDMFDDLCGEYICQTCEEDEVDEPEINEEDDDWDDSYCEEDDKIYDDDEVKGN